MKSFHQHLGRCGQEMCARWSTAATSFSWYRNKQQLAVKVSYTQLANHLNGSSSNGIFTLSRSDNRCSISFVFFRLHTDFHDFALCVWRRDLRNNSVEIKKSQRTLISVGSTQPWPNSRFWQSGGTCSCRSQLIEFVYPYDFENEMKSFGWVRSNPIGQLIWIPFSQNGRHRRWIVKRVERAIEKIVR